MITLIEHNQIVVIYCLSIFLIFSLFFGFIFSKYSSNIKNISDAYDNKIKKQEQEIEKLKKQIPTQIE